MSLDQALLEMELVGHDFYLFIDSEHRRPSVVYRRKAYDYGVIRLDTAATRSLGLDQRASPLRPSTTVTTRRRAVG